MVWPHSQSEPPGTIPVDADYRENIGDGLDGRIRQLPSGVIRLTREALYEKVWATPLTDLAPTLGFTERSLRTLCNRNGIPHPPIGFWTKTRAGRKVEKQPQLPPAACGAQERFYFRPTPKNDVRIPEDPEPFHPIVATWLADLDRQVHSARGASRLELQARVGTHSRRRMHRVADALLKHWDAEGITTTSDGYGSIRLQSEGEDLVRLSIEDKIDGTLWLVISGRLAPFARRAWKDRPSKPLETRLEKIHATISQSITFAAEKRSKFLEWKAKVEREHAKIARRQEEEKCWERVVGLGRQRADALSVRQLLEALEAEITPIDHRETHAEFFTWARERLKVMDPLSDPVATIRRVTPPRGEQ